MTSPAPTCSLREHQMVMLELLHQVDEVCRRHDISYALFAGSMLGAVRHKGFIPWDDDLDLIFLRADYERFLTIAETELDPALYHVQREFSPHWPMQSSKLRRNDTTCLEKYYPKDPKMHRGIYIDIFPCDALSDNRFIALLQFLASKVVIAKALDARGYVTHSTAKKLAMVLTRLLPRKPFVYLTRLGDRQNTRLVHTFFGGSKRWEKGVFPRMWLEHTIRVSFEDASKFLRRLYLEDFSGGVRSYSVLFKSRASFFLGTLLSQKVIEKNN